jgi:histidinol-phosphate aminotransferase
MKIPARFAELSPYIPIEPFEVLSQRLGIPQDQILKMDANENPYGPSPRLPEVLASLPFAHIYPDPESRALRAALAEFTGVPAQNLMAGSGADELIDLLLRILIEPGDRVVNCPPTFGMYSFDTLLNRGQLIEVPRHENFSIRLEALREAVITHQPKVLFLTTPNNPDGSLLSTAELDALLDLPVLIVLDEAYIEFTNGGGRLGEGKSRIQSVMVRENLVVLRTFSKWAGLAGLRVGYGAFPTWLMPVLWKAKQPYNVNVAATAAALVSLQDLNPLIENVGRIKAERERLYQHLQEIPYLAPFPSEANFILCKVKGRPAADLKGALQKRGVLVRYYNTPLLHDFIRISVGKSQDTDRLLSELKLLIV